MREAVLGLDVGTQSVKAVAVDASGTLLTEASQDYPLYIPQPGWTEQEPFEMWQAACSAIRKVLNALAVAGDDYRIRAVCATGQMHSLILLDEQNQPVGRALLWNDGRAADIAEKSRNRLTEALGPSYLLEVLCNDFLANWTGAHIAYVKDCYERFHSGARDEETGRWAEAWEKARSFLTPRDFIAYQLTGVRAMDMCGGSETSLMDLPAKKWAEDAFRILGLDQLTPPPLMEPGEVIGSVTRKAADETGLEEGTAVVAGAGDCLAGGLAGGVLKVGQVLFTLGTSGVIVAPIGTKPLVDPQLRTQVHYSTVPNVLVNMGCVNGAGIGLRLYRDVLGAPFRSVAEALGRDPYELLIEAAAQVPPGSYGLMFSPYITGDRLVKAPQGRGAWYGLTAFLMEEESKREAGLIRSVLEGICLAVRDAWEIIRSLLPDQEFEPIRMVGGGSRSLFWAQMTADILGHPVALTTARDASYGMALLAQVGAGWCSLEDATRAIQVTRIFQPRPAFQGFYDLFYHEVFKGHYDRSQRELDERMISLLSRPEYRDALNAWKAER
ncbi:MAG: FGGY family carbohydrate kinase [Armatimonadetes bacterium]|nr:FGGY family carbohydrate kinase [Armatimonadota bacterium]MDW8121403.1 FGGY family carbohydrate kinase [Armatimonadota bacterium]